MRNSNLILLLLISTLLSGCLSAPETHLIPDTYQGEVFIVPNIASGAEPIREGFSMVFTIPANGILVTSDGLSQEWHSTRFYDVDAAGNRERLEEVRSTVHNTPENRADTRRFMYFRRYGRLEGTDFPCPIPYTMYYIGTRADLLTRDHNADQSRFEEYIRAHQLCPEPGA